MSRREQLKRKRARTMIPAVGAPYTFTNMKRARALESHGDGVLRDGVYYHGLAWQRERILRERREPGYHGPQGSGYSLKMSHEIGEGGPLVLQLKTLHTPEETEGPTEGFRFGRDNG